MAQETQRGESQIKTESKYDIDEQLESRGYKIRKLNEAAREQKQLEEPYQDAKKEKKMIVLRRWSRCCSYSVWLCGLYYGDASCFKVFPRS